MQTSHLSRRRAYEDFTSLEREPINFPFSIEMNVYIGLWVSREMIMACPASSGISLSLSLAVYMCISDLLKYA